jgi:RNA polymerase sigma factor (sigma-70 family)
MDDQEQLQRLIDGLRQGNSTCGREFFEQYGPLLNRLAQKHLASYLHRRVDPDDVVQSVCRTFLGHLQQGAYELSDSQSLFSLLCAITLNKVLKTARYYRAGKRDLRREVQAAPSAEDSSPNFEAADREPPPDQAAEFADEFQRLLGALDDEERRILELKLEGRKTQEIAEAMHRTDRWVRKVLERLRSRLGSDADKADA